MVQHEGDKKGQPCCSLPSTPWCQSHLVLWCQPPLDSTSWPWQNQELQTQDSSHLVCSSALATRKHNLKTANLQVYHCKWVQRHEWHSSIQHHSFRIWSNCAERSCHMECPSFGDIVSVLICSMSSLLSHQSPEQANRLHKCPRQMSHDGTAESEPHRWFATYSAQLIWRS